MRYKLLGKSGVRISEVALGTMRTVLAQRLEYGRKVANLERRTGPGRRLRQGPVRHGAASIPLQSG